MHCNFFFPSFYEKYFLPWVAFSALVSLSTPFPFNYLFTTATCFYIRKTD